jgi:hypothetical protein
VCIKNSRRKHRIIWVESDRRASACTLADHLSWSVGDSSAKSLQIFFPFALDDGFELIGESIDDGCTDPMETSRDFVSALFSSKLSSCMEDSEDCLESRLACLWVYVSRDTTTIIDHTTRSISMEYDLDIFGMTCHSLIDRVVDDLPDEVMKTSLISRSDIHTGSFSDWLQTFEYLDI